MAPNPFIGRATQQLGGQFSARLPWQILSGTLKNQKAHSPSPSGSFSPRRAARLAATRRMEAVAGLRGAGRSGDWLRESLMGGASQAPAPQAGVLSGLNEPSISTAESSAMQNPYAWRRLYGSVGDLFNRSP